MAEFAKKKEANNPLFKFVWRYMQMVLLIYNFIHATRDGLWELHLSSLDGLCKYFFAHDKQKYARLVPLYLPCRPRIQIYTLNSWMEISLSIRIRHHSVPLGWIMHLSTLIAS